MFFSLVINVFLYFSLKQDIQCLAAKAHTKNELVMKRIIKYILHNEKVESKKTTLERKGTSTG